MKYKNETFEGIKMPVKQPAPFAPNWLTFKPGETKEVPFGAEEAASLMGLTAVEETPEETKEEEIKHVEAEESSIAETKVETKKVKKKTKKSKKGE